MSALKQAYKNLKPRWDSVRRTLILPKALLNVPNYRLVRHLQSRNIWPDGACYDRKAGTFTISGEDVRVKTCGRDLVYDFSGLRVFVENDYDYILAYDVLTRHRLAQYWCLYDLELPAGRDVVVWDIGANIGTASILFAGRKGVVAVYGYEPFQHTFDCYKRTIALNPTLAERIIPFNCGVDSSNRTAKLPWSAKFKTDAGLHSLGEKHRARLNLTEKDLTLEEVTIVDAAEVMRMIRDRHPDATILVKMDCEQSEYAIFDRLIEAGQIGQVYAASVECHGPWAPELAAKLKAAGFATHLRLNSAALNLHLLDIKRLDAQNS